MAKEIRISKKQSYKILSNLNGCLIGCWENWCVTSRERQSHLIILQVYKHYVTIIKLCHPLSNGPQSPRIFVEEI